MHTIKYAVCLVSFSIGEATEVGHIVWLTDSIWSFEVEDATLFSDRAEAEAKYQEALNSVEPEMVVNIVAVNLYDVSFQEETNF